MLDSKETSKIEQFVYSKPRSIQEIAVHLTKNWRTADRYVSEIEKNYGTLATRTFREGTRGALKIVYWASMEKISKSVFQEELEKEITTTGKTKYDFSPFDIFQHVKDSEKNAIVFDSTENTEDRRDEMNKAIESAEKQVLFFSGNMSFINDKTKKYDPFKILENLAKKGVIIKILTRVDLAGKTNIEKVESINRRVGKEAVEVRHARQPLRAVIVDGKLAKLKETEEPTKKQNETQKGDIIIYNITSKDWIEWMTKLFWKRFSNSISAEKRLQEINKLKNFTTQK